MIVRGRRSVRLFLVRIRGGFRHRRAHGALPGRRVVFLTWRDTAHPEGGGSEVFVERIASHLAASGHEVTILCAAHGGAPADEVRDGVRFHRRGSRLGVYLRGMAYLLLGAGRHADVVVDVQNGIPFFAPLVRRRPIMVLLHHVHREQWQIIYPGRRGQLGWWIESRLSPWLYRKHPYVTVSEASRRDLIALGVDEHRIALVHNGIDVPHPDHSLPRSTDPTICVLGRLVPHKQVEHALQVAATLRTQLPGLRVEIVGDGWWREQLEVHAAQLGVSDLVTFHGHVSDEARGRLLDRSWVLLVPSVKEGWGIAIMEAAARGVPAIAYESAGGVCESICDTVTGRLVPDLADLTKRTAELLTDADLRNRFADAARLRAASYDWSSSADAFERALQAAATGSDRPSGQREP
jgi:glycosyltransferase involved in cell wall biosynthesis